jgi:hypothetical protein
MPQPSAVIVHKTGERMRIRIPEKKKDEKFFHQSAELFKGAPGVRSVQSNPLTASILLKGDLSDPNGIAEHVSSSTILRLDTAENRKIPLRKRIYRSFDRGNRLLKESSREELDLPLLIFLVLVGTGIYQIARSEVPLPPWYTAFWYALGIFSKSLVEGDLDMADADD